MKNKLFFIDGKIVQGDCRASIQYEPTHGFSVSQCDLCDEENYPMVSWHCEHDDPAHVTTVCLKCLYEIIESEKNDE